ncbi:MAG: hypothetical protein ACI4KH_04385 [Oscillospiraceae bacterium]
MKKYMLSIIKEYEALLCDEGSDKKAVRKELLTRIEFMQHERLVHLIVTALFAVLLIICVAGFICFEKIVFVPLIILMLCLVIPYIAHYFFLENNTQKLYSIYEEYTKRINDEN